jgi:hypothetical protein
MNASKETLFSDKNPKKSLSYLFKAFSEHPRHSVHIFFQLVNKIVKNKPLEKTDIT